MAVCRTSRLIEFEGHIARLRERYCEKCKRHTQTIEFESRVLFTGEKTDKRDDSFVRDNRLF